MYSHKTDDGTFYGEIGPRDKQRFKDTIQFVQVDIKTVLDIGCFGGDWLAFLRRHKRLEQCLGIDVSAERIMAAQKKHPDIDFQQKKAEDLISESERFDLVTCLEVLEHIPDWQNVFESLFSLARKQVLITVPYREKIQYHPCVHCGNMTPSWGHLHSFTEDSFPERHGWQRSTGLLKERHVTGHPLWKVIRLFRPWYRWMLVSYNH